MKNIKTGVIGLGLIGGSIFKGLLKLGYNVIGISKSQKGDRIFKDYSYLKDCGLVFVCSKMQDTLNVLDKLENVLGTKTIVCDVSSVKSFVLGKKYSYNFIPSHPMAGTEFSGFEASFPELFDGAKWVISKHNKTLEKIITDLGAKPLIVKPKEHDRAAALISHMPMLLANALFDCVSGDDIALRLASSGFRDMTRLSMTNSDLALDMIKYNEKNINKAIKKFTKSLNNLQKMSESEKIKLLKKNAQVRSKMYKDGKNQID